MAPTLSTVRYLSPEKLIDHVKNKYSVKCEIYSLGVLLWEIAEEKIPYYGKDDIIAIRDLVLKEKVPLPFSHGVPDEWKKISQEATRHDPEARPPLKEMFMVLYDLNEREKSDRPGILQRVSTDSTKSGSSSPLPEMENLTLNAAKNRKIPDPDNDDDLAIDFTELSKLMSVDAAVREYKKPNGDKEAAFSAFQQHAEFGDMQAKYWVGYYLYYDILPQNPPLDKAVRYERAAGLFQEAADSGIADAQLRFGHCLWSGEGCRKNIPQAIQYFQLAADNGNITGMYNIGNVYFNGLGVKKDEKKGRRYLRLAALGDQPKAKKMCADRGISLAEVED